MKIGMVKVTLGGLQKALPELQKKFNDEIPDPLQKAILTQLSNGVSPVAGVGRFQGYSDTYKTEIVRGYLDKYGKKLRPVNLYLSGGLYGSLTITKVGNGLVVSFTSDLAKYHNDQGAGKAKVIRRLLPTKSGEKFNAAIMRDVRKILGWMALNVIASQKH